VQQHLLFDLLRCGLPDVLVLCLSDMVHLLHTLYAAAGSDDSGLLGRQPKLADAGRNSSAYQVAGGAYMWTAARVEALEPYPLPDATTRREHAPALTQLVSWGAVSCRFTRSLSFLW
jgi:hypothetical protein